MRKAKKKIFVFGVILFCLVVLVYIVLYWNSSDEIEHVQLLLHISSEFSKFSDRDQQSNFFLQSHNFKSKPLLKFGSDFEYMKPNREVDEIEKPLSLNFPPISAEGKTMLKRYADRNNNIIVSVVDSDLLEFVLNFYETSLKVLAIRNFISICVSREVERSLLRYGYPCLFYDIEHLLVNGEGDFATATYYMRTNIKTLVGLQVLEFGFNVLLIDLDVLLFKNPFDYFTCASCDIHVQMDRVMWNSGFVYAKSNSRSVALYRYAWKFYSQYQKSHDQAYFAMALRLLLANSSITVQELSPELFPCGMYYFETDRRTFNNIPVCNNCVMVHNNYLGSQVAKIYRFRENLLWNTDHDGYYSDVGNKYIIYENFLYHGDKTLSYELDALKSAMAIGQITGRIVILPAFHCCSCKTGRCAHWKHRCSLLSILRVKNFDEVFKNRYREHSFLSNTKVPFSVMQSKSQLLFINSSDAHAVLKSLSTTDVHWHTFNPENMEKGATEEELSNWLQPMSNITLLRFHSLYRAFHRFKMPAHDNQFRIDVEFAFECASYQQWSKNLEQEI